MDFLSLLALALAPGVAIVIYIYLKDKHEREPLRLLMLSFFFGMLSTVITVLLSWSSDNFFIAEEGNALSQFFNAFFKVALVEEFSKFLFVRFVLFYNRNFNEPFDGIVYAVLVSMGFATLENVLYVFESGYVTGILRIFTAVPAHATFGVLMGYFLGKAKFNGGSYWSAMALVAATGFHGAYDYFWFISYMPGIWLGAIASLVLGFILSRHAIRLHQQASPFAQATQDLTDVHSGDAR